MDLVLKSGDIHYLQPTRESTRCLPTVQFLALNRQAYTEGRDIFYPENNFHLPAGPRDYTNSMLDRYQPQNLAMIRHVTLHIGLHDLCYVESYKQLNTKTWGVIGMSDYTGIEDGLVKIWKSKMIFVRKNFPNLEELRVVFWDLDYDELRREGDIDADFHQPYPLLRGTKATIPAANGGATPKRVLALAYKGEDIKAALQDIHMDPKWRLIDSRPSRILRRTFAEATNQFGYDIQALRTWEGLRRKIMKTTTEHELRVRG